jgi:hypothetical protein
MVAEDLKVENVPLAGSPQRPADTEAAHLARLVEALRAENEMLKASLSVSGGRVTSAVIARPEVDSSPETARRTGPVHPAPTRIAPLFLEPSLIPPPPVMQADSCVVSPAMHAAEGAAPESPEWPSVGSVGHFSGQCKPCVHFHKKGCRNGTECTFCHLCDAGEVKRRQSKKCARRQQSGVKMGLAFSGRC